MTNSASRLIFDFFYNFIFASIIPITIFQIAINNSKISGTMFDIEHIPSNISLWE